MSVVTRKSDSVAAVLLVAAAATAAAAAATVAAVLAARREFRPRLLARKARLLVRHEELLDRLPVVGRLLLARAVDGERDVDVATRHVLGQLTPLVELLAAALKTIFELSSEVSYSGPKMMFVRA